ncbi:MAG: phytoene/squalene synthase family protein [Rubricella sp.]
MSAEADIAACREAIRHGSKSFHAASFLLPRRMREDALALYAFCRLADDAVDLQEAKVSAVLDLGARLDAIYAGRPHDDPADRAFARVVERHEMPRGLPDALLEGFAWDAEARAYRTLSDVRAYSARVAAAVGAMMAVLAGNREKGTLARACDMGVAMQLTNIARDIGEDARMGRIYIPLDWLAEAGIDPDALIADPAPTPELRHVTARLLAEAERLYRRAMPGIAHLPRQHRMAMIACRHIYGAIGSEIARAGHDSVTTRAHTGPGRKIGLLSRSICEAAVMAIAPKPLTTDRPLPETAFLVDIAARTAPSAGEERLDRILDIFADLKRREAAARSQGIAAE